MSSAEDLLSAVRGAEAGGDPDAVDAARGAYLEVNPSGPEAAEIRFRHGVSTLMRQRNTDAALALFKAAAADKGAEIAPQARIAYASVLFSKSKQTQAIFELRKLLPERAEPSVNTVSALEFLALFLRETGAKPADIAKVQDRRFEHIDALAKGADNVEERAHWMLRLATAYADGSEPGDLQRAREKYSELIKLGARAGKDTLKAAREGLKSLPR